MRARFMPIVALAALSVLCGCASTGGARTGASPALLQAHDDFVAAINLNDVDAFLAMLTHDVVLMPPHAPRLVGAPAVRYWAKEYLAAFETHWVKSTLEFQVLGDWAFEQYSYQSTDIPRDGGESVHDIGKGIIIYHRESDGKWRVARDAWNSDVAVVQQD